MSHNIKPPELVAGLDWGVFRKEGDPYLRRLGVSDDMAIWMAAKLYLSSWTAWKSGKRWSAKRSRWEQPKFTKRLDTPTVFAADGTPLLEWNGKFLPPSRAPGVCETCGGHCAATAANCIVCWDRIRPRKKGAVRRHRPEARYLAHVESEEGGRSR